MIPRLPVLYKMRLASFYMEGKAMIWYQNLENFGAIVDWETFGKTLLTRFGPSTYNDPVEP